MTHIEKNKNALFLINWNCFTGTNSWPHGNSLINYMKLVEFVGLSGPIKLDQTGTRTEFAMTLQELQIQELVRYLRYKSINTF